jgi:hypothetical protein
MGLNPEQARKLLEANSVLLVKKVVEEKKPLTLQEITLLQAVAGEQEKTWADTQVDLSAVLGVDRKTIQRWLKIDGNPGARPNGKYNIAEWKSWRASRSGDFDSPDLDQTQLKAENLLLQNERLRFQIGVLKREYWPAEQVEIWGGELGAAIRKVVTALHLTAADLADSTVAECEKILKEKEDEILAQLHTLDAVMQEWKDGTGDEVKDEPVS